ncbi:MAG: glutathione-disulfide reductase [Alphaproteobacteria bacterium]|nr:glutathione-disulfide reductase [Alphaproteobacteria bacterium]
MPENDYDLFVIGGGSGGVRASRMAALAGKRVAIAEEYQFGGTCVIRGCIPKKLFVYASQYGEDFQDAAGFGWSVPERRFDWTTLVANKDKEIARLSDLYVQNVRKAGAEIFLERAELIGPHTLRLTKSGKTVSAQYILIATGGRPSHDTLDIPGVEHCISSNDAFYLEKLPRRIIVVGGGYIAVEFAHIFHGLGCDTTLVYRGDKVLRGFDEDMRDCIMEEMARNGLRVICNRNFKRIDKRGDELFAFTDHNEIIETDAVMLAIGRRPNTDGLGIEGAGVALGPKGEVVVNEYSRTTVQHIYAIGDVTNRLQLTPVAIHEAMCFIRTVFDNKPTPVDHRLVPTAVFCRPEIATVGLTETKALQAGHAVDVYSSTFKPLKHTLSGRETRSRFKLVVDSQTGKVLGCHVFSFDAAELVQLAAVALKMGATKDQFDGTIGLHPTAAEELVTMRTKAYSKSPAAPLA